jgi:uncharacterized protein GlcG (DUF336 family)
MWAAVVDPFGNVAAVAYSGEEMRSQWLASRLIAAEKASTANALALPASAISTANLYSAAQPGGSLYGIAIAVLPNVTIAYGGNPNEYGTPTDFLVGKPIGGFIVFGGGFALYDRDGRLAGGLGVSGDIAGADHNIAWKLRHELALDYVPSGNNPVRVAGKPQDDNIVFDLDENTGKSASGWGHPVSSPASQAIALALPTTHPIRAVDKNVAARRA